MDIQVPSHYSSFKCIGSLCEDTCCSGWAVHIDSKTFRLYRLNKHPELAPLFKIALSREDANSAKNATAFGRMKMKTDGSCHFLQADRLCSIQRIMGSEALSHTCKTYPRYHNQFGGQREYSLAISCPEAARLVLLSSDPISFHTIPEDSGTKDTFIAAYRFPRNSDGDPSQIAILNDFRAVILAILQRRELKLGTRLMLLGFCLFDAEKIVLSSEFSDAAELVPVIESYAGMLQKTATLESKFDQIKPDLARKLEVMTRLILNVLSNERPSRFSQTLQTAVEGLQGGPGDFLSSEGGLLGRYTAAFENYLVPYISERAHVFENYLVNQVVTHLFPFVRGTYLDLYRELVFNVSILHVLLVGVAAKHCSMTDSLLIDVFQGYSRKSDHDKRHLDNLTKTLCGSENDSFFDVMWMLKDSAE
jgi:lysine-N-methylase